MAQARMLILILVVFSSWPLWGQDKTIALVRRIQGLELLPPNISRQLEKISLQVVAKQKGFELLLSGSDTPSASPIDMLAVESEVLKTGNHYRLEARLLNLKSKKLVSRTSQENIREEDLVRLFQAAMEALFRDYEPEGAGKEVKEKRTPNAPPALKKPVPNTTQLNTPDHPTIDFKKRIADLKSGVDEQIVKVVEEKKEEAAKAKAENQNNQSGIAFNKLVTEDPFNKLVPQKVYPRQHRLSVAYDSRDIRSIALVEATVAGQFVDFKASGHSPTSFFDGKTAWSYDFTYSLPQSVEVETPTIYQLGLYASWLGKNGSLSAGVFRDASFFVNLPTPGAGLLPSSLTSTWSRIKAEYTLPFKWPWRIGASYASSLQAQSDYKPISSAKKWQGSHVHFDLSPHYVVLGCQFNIMMERLNLTTQGEVPFTFTESRLAFSVQRSF